MKKGKYYNEYRKQRRRIQSAIRRQEKAGYIVDKSILPSIPKKITKASISRLSKITPEKIRQKSQYIIHETGEIIPVKGNIKLIKEDVKYIKEQRKKEREYTPEKPKVIDEVVYPNFADIVIRNFKSLILGFPPSIVEMVMPLINTIIAENGKSAVAEALQAMPMEFHEYLLRHKHDSNGGVSDFATALIDYIPDVSEQYKKDLMEKFEYQEMGYTIEDEETQI